MAEKVKVSRETASILDYIIKKYGGDTERAFEYVAPTMTVWNEELGINQTLSISKLEFAKALLGVYEIEPTPQEKALKFYNSFDCTPLGEASERSAIRTFLHLAEIEIEGIND